MSILHRALQLLPDSEPPPWRADAACRVDRSACDFFPGGDRGQTLAMTNAARKVCRGCPVKIDCLLYAIETRQEYGVWGGATEPERKRLQRKLGAAKSVERAVEILTLSQ